MNTKQDLAESKNELSTRFDEVMANQRKNESKFNKDDFLLFAVLNIVYRVGQLSQ
jgi:hypothetical protein